MNAAPRGGLRRRVGAGRTRCGGAGVTAPPPWRGGAARPRFALAVQRARRARAGALVEAGHQGHTHFVIRLYLVGTNDGEHAMGHERSERAPICSLIGTKKKDKNMDFFAMIFDFWH